MTPGSCPSDTSAHPRSHGENAVAARMDRQQIGSSPLTRGKREYITARARDWGLIPAHAGKTSSEPLSLASRPAHPHSRRENRPMTIVRPIHTDSSPLTRGKRIRLASTRSHFRLIPAHAGKTLEKTLAREPSGAHPRSRGENISSRSAIWFLRGSSPLTRGKLMGYLSPIEDARLIPAHAGKTSSRCSRKDCMPAHPRSRGENHMHTAPTSAFAGSSPLTRGKPSDLITPIPAPRLIPAHAGKTSAPAFSRACIAAHPRSRGENTADDALTAQPAGSSPLTRGKQPSQRSRCTAMRLIPAHAGKTLAVPLVETIQRAHPRSRGENHCRLDVDISIGGSSPLTRGKRPLIGLFWPVSRLIPAHAGKTSSSQAGGPRCRAHPRSRGENVRKRSNGIYTLGSSPLTRGKRFNVGAGLRITRLIPAHAGKTRVQCCPRRP